MLSIESYLTGFAIALSRFRTVLRLTSSAALLLALAFVPLLVLFGFSGFAGGLPDPEARLADWLGGDWLSGDWPRDRWSASAAGIGLVLLLHTLFFQGGLVRQVGGEERDSARSFFGGCGEHFLRTARAAVLPLALAAAWVFGAGQLWVHWRAEPPYGGNLRSVEVPLVLAIGGLGVWAPLLAFDLTTIVAEIERRNSALGALHGAVSALASAPFRFFVLELLSASGLVGVGLGAKALFETLPEDGWLLALFVTMLVLAVSFLRLQLVAARSVLARRCLSARAPVRERARPSGYSPLEIEDLESI
ncbi:MAG: hypothetical protein RL885_15975 [Planctomycetota bacterium]